MNDKEIFDSIDKSTAKFMAVAMKYEIKKVSILDITILHSQLEDHVQSCGCMNSIVNLSEVSTKMAEHYDDMKDMLSDMTYQIGEIAFGMRERSKNLKQIAKDMK